MTILYSWLLLVAVFAFLLLAYVVIDRVIPDAFFDVGAPAPAAPDIEDDPADPGLYLEHVPTGYVAGGREITIATVKGFDKRNQRASREQASVVSFEARRRQQLNAAVTIPATFNGEGRAS